MTEHSETKRSNRPPRRDNAARRPRKAGSTPEDGPRLTDAEYREKQEQRFMETIENRIKYFLLSDEPELDLEPMNSYKRRLIHKVATQYDLDTESRGEEPDRRVCVLRTKEAKVPEGRSRPKLWDFGSQTFPVNPGQDGVHLALKMDGSIELWQEGQTNGVVNDRLVNSREIRIRDGRIVTPDDPEW